MIYMRRRLLLLAAASVTAPLPTLAPLPLLMPALPAHAAGPRPLPPQPPLLPLQPRPQMLSALASMVFSSGAPERQKPRTSEAEESAVDLASRQFHDLSAKASAIGGPFGTMLTGSVVPMASGGGTPGGSDIRIGEMLAAAPDRPSAMPSYAPMMRLATPYLFDSQATAHISSALAQALGSSDAAKSLGSLVGA